MTSTLRSTLSASIALGLASFTLTASFVLGAADPATVLGFGLLAAYGVAEIALIAYREPRSIVAPRPVSTTRAQTRSTPGAILTFPVSARAQLARAA